MSTPEQPGSSATIHATFNGFTVALHTTGKTVGQIEQLIEGLASRGWQPAPSGAMPATTGTNGKPKAPAVVNFTPAGIPICPVHLVAMKESQHSGYYCAKKAEPGQPQNDRGYCSCSYRD